MSGLQGPQGFAKPDETNGEMSDILVGCHGFRSYDDESSKGHKALCLTRTCFCSRLSVVHQRPRVTVLAHKFAPCRARGLLDFVSRGKPLHENTSHCVPPSVGLLVFIQLQKLLLVLVIFLDTCLCRLATSVVLQRPSLGVIWFFAGTREPLIASKLCLIDSPLKGQQFLRRSTTPFSKVNYIINRGYPLCREYAPHPHFYMNVSVIESEDLTPN